MSDRQCQQGDITMDFASYYLELFEMLNQACRKIASGHYDQRDAERLFELAKRERYPSLLSDLAEAFGMMMVKLEAREYSLKEAIEELEKTKAELEKRLACGTGES
jgi:hypothetical protein